MVRLKHLFSSFYSIWHICDMCEWMRQRMRRYNDLNRHKPVKCMRQLNFSVFFPVFKGRRHSSRTRDHLVFPKKVARDLKVDTHKHWMWSFARTWRCCNKTHPTENWKAEYNNLTILVADWWCYLRFENKCVEVHFWAKKVHLQLHTYPLSVLNWAAQSFSIFLPHWKK